MKKPKKQHPTPLSGSVLREKNIIRPIKASWKVGHRLSPLENRHRQGYFDRPISRREASAWKKEQSWGELDKESIWATMKKVAKKGRIKTMNQKPAGAIAVLQGGVLSLPASFKRQLHTKSGRAFVVEEHGNNLLLKPFEIELYSNEQIARWKKEGSLTRKEMAALRKKILSNKK